MEASKEPGDRIGLCLIEELCGVIPLRRTTNPEPPMDLYLSGVYDIPSHRWTAMLKFLKTPWFWRIWILQEYHKAKDRIFQCGKILITAGFFRDFYIKVSKYRELRDLVQLKGLALQPGEQLKLFLPFFEFGSIWMRRNQKTLEVPSSPVVE
jgi:hypothetical protein